MKTIGLLGGMSWESTLTYYQIINMVTAQTLGGLHSARCLLYSVDFDEIERCQQAGDWDRSARILADADSWRNNRGDKSGITRDEPGHTGKTLCNFIAWDENRRGGKSLPFSSLLDGVRVWPESLFRLSTHHGSGSVGGVLPHLGKPTVGPLAVVFFHR